MTPKPDVEFDGDLVLIRIPRGLVVLTTQEFTRALGRGKGYKRAQALKARVEGRQEDYGHSH